VGSGQWLVKRGRGDGIGRETERAVGRDE